MPIEIPELRVGASGASGGSDIYLHVKTARSGKIKGESRVAGRLDDIQVMQWQWAVRGSPAHSAGKAQGRRTWSELVVIKKIDRATNKKGHSMTG